MGFWLIRHLCCVFFYVYWYACRRCQIWICLQITFSKHIHSPKRFSCKKCSYVNSPSWVFANSIFNNYFDFLLINGMQFYCYAIYYKHCTGDLKITLAIHDLFLFFIPAPLVLKNTIMVYALSITCLQTNETLRMENELFINLEAHLVPWF